MTIKLEPLKMALLQWDRRRTDFLMELYEEKNEGRQFMDYLIQIYSNDSGLEHATSWLIKHHMDKGNQLTAAQLNELFKKLGDLDYWESQLHILQIIAKVNLTKDQIPAVEPWIKRWMSSDKKFVKAAAFEAYWQIVKVLPELKSQFRLTCENALNKESASVKVKIRRILNKL